VLVPWFLKKKLSINITSVSANSVDLSPIPYVGRFVCVHPDSTVAKQLTGSG